MFEITRPTREQLLLATVSVDIQTQRREDRRDSNSSDLLRTGLGGSRKPKQFQVFGNSALALVILWLSAWPSSGGVGTPPVSLQRRVQSLPPVAQLALSATDSQAELAADLKTGSQVPLRFAVEHHVKVSPETDGAWEQLSDGRLWRFRVASVGATDLNLGFTTFWLPDGATLHLIAESEPYYQGPYASRDNKPHGQLWTAVVPGDAAVIELFVPAGATNEARLILTQINTGYRDLFHRQKDFTNQTPSGPCNIDVACPQAAGWSNEVRSVARYSISGTTLCTGTLVANAAGDFRNYFLTANHCGLNPSNAASVVVYWNYQSPVCGEHGGGTLAENQSGAIFRAARYDVDFALVELEDTPDSGFNVYYSGWDRSGTAPASSVGIHHPNGAEKSISICSSPLSTGNSCIGTGGVGTHWQVIWSAGVTESGSSGSGIWDAATHRLVGTLSGGNSSCASPAAPDCYGKLSVAWDGGISSGERLREWLDPQSTGVLAIPGADPSHISTIQTAGSNLILEGCSPTNGAVDPGETVTVDFALTNAGGALATDLVATLLSTNGVTLPSAAQHYGVLAPGGPGVSRLFTFTATGTCGNVITPEFQLQDGTRNLGTVRLGLTLGAPILVVSFSENFDGVAGLALPVGWASSVAGLTQAWTVSNAQADTPPNAAFAPDVSNVADNRLDSPMIAVNSSGVRLTFRHKYDLEEGFDGGVLEISVNSGAFVDILSAGGSFVTNGYDATLSKYCRNPLAGRRTWSGNSGGFITSIVELPSGASGQNVQLRWRLGTDGSTGAGGWFLDSISVAETRYACCSGFALPLIVDTHLVDGGRIAFSYATDIGRTYYLEAATNLDRMDWMVLQLDLGDGSRRFFTNSTTAPAQQYFRLRVQ